MLTNHRYLSFSIIICIIALVIFSLNIETELTPSSVLTQTTQPNTAEAPTTNTTIENTITSINNNTQPSSNLTSNPSNPFNGNNLTKTVKNEYNPNLPPGFPKSLPPLDPEQLKQSDDLIATGDAIVAEMDALISGLDLPEVKLSATEQAQLDSQRQIQQTRLEDIKAQLEALKQDL